MLKMREYVVDIHGPGARFIFRGNIIGCNQIVGMCKAFTANSKPSYFY